MRETEHESCDCWVPQAMERAKEIQKNLSPECPSFIKLMYKSHVYSGLNPPSGFWGRYLPRNREDYVFEAESGQSYNVKYNYVYPVFSRGWKCFSRSEELMENDILIFHLVEPGKFKVYIVRASSFASVCKCVKIEDCEEEEEEEEEDVDQERAFEKDEKYPTFVPQNILEKSIQAISNNFEIFQSRKKMRKAEDKYPNSFDSWSPLESKSEIEKILQGPNDSADQDTTRTFPNAHGHLEENISEGADNFNTEGSSPIDLNLDRATGRIELENEANMHEKTKETKLPLLNVEDDMSMLNDHSGSEHSNLPTNAEQLAPDFESFQITVNGYNIEQELSFEIRKKYFYLCASQKSLLHAHCLPTMSSQLAAVVISETVKITELILECNLGSGPKNLETWDKTLAGFEMFGMNVTFIRLRINRLLGLCMESEEKVDNKRSGEINIEKVRVDDEMKRLEAKMIEIKKVERRMSDEIEDIQAMAMKYEEWFSEEASASW